MHKKIRRFGDYKMKEYLKDDIEYLASNKDVLEDFDGKNILITGASGLIGSLIAKSLCEYERSNTSGMHIYALIRNQEKAHNVFKEYLNDSFLHFINADISEKLFVERKLDYIIHGASITDSKLFVSKPVETIDTLVNGTKNILDLAKMHQIERFLFISSLEVYGKPEIEDYKVDEDYVGYLDFTAVRSSYSEGKRIAECLCNSYFSEYSVPIVTARLAQTFGPGVDYNDGRVFAQFARCVINNENIRLNTEGRTYRNYCYVRDAIAAIFYIMTKGTPGEAYNVANKNTGITIAEMAQMVSENVNLGQGKIKVVYNHPEELKLYGYNPEMKIELLTDKLERLGWKPEVSLEHMFVRMIHDMKLQKSKNVLEN